MKPVGIFRTDSDKVPRHWSVSEMEGRIELRPEYVPGIKDIEPGQSIVVIFHFDRSRAFDSGLLAQTPPHRDTPMGVCSICSPVRPNPIGMSVLEVTAVSGNSIEVRHADMLDKTPVLDIKPHVVGRHNCPSNEGGD